MDFETFKTFWFEEAEKKLLRCTKEFGIYEKTKNILNPKRKRDRIFSLYILYHDTISNITSYGNTFVTFYYPTTKTKRECSTELVLTDKRHFSQAFAFTILGKIPCCYKTFVNTCKMYDKEIYKEHKIEAKKKKKLSLIKLLFK